MRNIRIFLSWLCGQHNITVHPFERKTLAVSKDPRTGKFAFYIFKDWLVSDDPAIEDILRGGFYHEALGHARHTTFSDFKDLETKTFKWTPLARHVRNILEDIYIELAAMKIYPTVRSGLSKTVEVLNSQGFFGTPEKFAQASTVELLSSCLLNFCRGRLLPDQAIHLQRNMDALEALIPHQLGALWPMVWDVAKESANATCSRDNALLTRKIMVMIKDVSEQDNTAQPAQAPVQPAQQQQSKSSQGKGSQSKSDDPSPGDGAAGQAEGDGGEQVAEDAAASSSTGKPSPDASTPASSSGPHPESKAQQDASNPSQQAGQDSRDSEQDGEETEGDPSSQSESVDVEENSSDTDASLDQGDDIGETEIEAARDIIKQLRQDIQSPELTDLIAKAIAKAVEKSGTGSSSAELQIVSPKFRYQSAEVIQVASVLKNTSDDLIEVLTEETFTRRELVKQGNRIDRKQLVPGACGFTDEIFVNEIKGDGLSTAVYGLFDYSGSMRAERSISGCSSPLVACEGIMQGLGAIFDEFEIPYEFAAFADVYMTVKSFDEDGDMIRKRKQSPAVDGGTITGAACQLAMSRLVCRPELKKLLLVVTDGDTADLPLLASCYNEAKYMGIEVASVMIGGMIPSIRKLSEQTGMKAISTKQVSGLGRFVVNQIKAAI